MPYARHPEECGPAGAMIFLPAVIARVGIGSRRLENVPGRSIRRIIVLVFILIIPLCHVGAAHAAAKPAPTVKSVALAFGRAIQHNDGGAAISLLAPTLRAHLRPDQLPAILGVRQAPVAVMVIRWAFAQGQGDATLGLRYANGIVTEQLSLHFYSNGWRITAISHEDAAALEQGAEAVVAAFCDGALNGEPAVMHAQVTGKLLKEWKPTTLAAALLGVSGSIRSYEMASYHGGPLGADIVVVVRSDTNSVRDLFEVINDRDGWRISGVSPQAG
jgi:hypothetical protein